MWATLLGQKEYVGDSLIDDSRRNFILLGIEIKNKAPLAGRIFLLSAATLFAFILLLKQACRLFLINSNEVLHLHNKHLNLIALANNMAHRYHLNGRSLIVDYAMLLIGMIGGIAKNGEQTSMEVVCFLNGIFHTRAVVDDKVLIVVVFLLQTNVRSADFLYFVVRDAGALLNFLKEVVAEIS